MTANVQLHHTGADRGTRRLVRGPLWRIGSGVKGRSDDARRGLPLSPAWRSAPEGPCYGREVHRVARIGTGKMPHRSAKHKRFSEPPARRLEGGRGDDAWRGL